MNREAALAVAAGLRAQIGALQANVVALEALLAGDPPMPADATSGCPHTETENVGTFGLPEMRCKACGVEVDV